MVNTLVFTPNAACSNLVVLRGIIPGASYDHTWHVENWNCVLASLVGNTNFTANKGFVLWFADAAGLLLVQVAGEVVGDPTLGVLQFDMLPADTELLRGQTIGRCGAAWVDSGNRNMPIEDGRYHINAWPALTWPTS